MPSGFAAKEAVMKALGVGLGAFGFHDVEIERAESGDPTLTLARQGRGHRRRTRRAPRGMLSLSHSDTIAIAVVAVE